jgi:hypothetical protein
MSPKHSLNHLTSIETEGDRAANSDICQNRMRTCAVLRVPLVEQEVTDCGRCDRDQPQGGISADAANVVGRRWNDVHRVCLAAQQQVEPCRWICSGPENQAFDLGLAKEETLNRRQLDELAGHIPNPSVGSASNRVLDKSGRC